jgi:hypothetical protein
MQALLWLVVYPSAVTGAFALLCWWVGRCAGLEALRAGRPRHRYLK